MVCLEMYESATDPTTHALLTAEDVRRYLALPSTASVYAMVRRGDLPGLRVGRRRLRFRQADVAALVQARDHENEGSNGR